MVWIYYKGAKEGCYMATSSIYAEFKINDKKSANRFMKVVESKETRDSKPSNVRFVTNKKEVDKFFK